MTKREFKILREELYRWVSLLGLDAEKYNSPTLEIAYEHASKMLNNLDQYGVLLGYLDPETNSLI